MKLDIKWKETYALQENNNIMKVFSCANAHDDRRIDNVRFLILPGYKISTK